jgi:hydrogenase maturation protease
MNDGPSILVIGLGNPLRGDDGIGWSAVDRLAAMFTEDSSKVELTKGKRVEFVKCRELMPEVSESVSKAEHVLFIDGAVETGNGIMDEEIMVPAETVPLVETHLLDPAGILAFSKSLYGNAPPAVMLTAKVESFEYREGLSQKAQRAVGLLVDRAGELLNDWLGESSTTVLDN